MLTFNHGLPFLEKVRGSSELHPGGSHEEKQGQGLIGGLFSLLDEVPSDFCNDEFADGSDRNLVGRKPI